MTTFETLSDMTQKQALGLVLQWLCAPEPVQGFKDHRKAFEEQLQSIARLQVACKLDAARAKQYMACCWNTVLGQYDILIRNVQANGDSSLKWWKHETERIATLRDMGPSHALCTFRETLRRYRSEGLLLFEAGGGDKGAEHYLEYLTHPAVLPQERCDYPDVLFVGGREEGAPPPSTDSDSDYVLTLTDSDSDSDAGASHPSWWAEQQSLFKAWMENANRQHWLLLAMMLQKCPGLRPYGGKLMEACQDPKALETAWVKSWPPRWKRQIPRAYDKTFL